MINELGWLYEYSFTPTREAVNELLELFKRFNSDKGFPHTYHPIYSALFLNRSSVKNVLEVGIYKGASLRAFKEYFPNANIVGLDIDSSTFLDEDRVQSLYANQVDSNSFPRVRAVTGEVEYDLIIDDGCHEILETVNTFECILPWLKIGGWYVIEDIKNKHKLQWKYIARSLPINYEAFLIDMNKDTFDPESGVGMTDNTVLVVHKKS